MGHYFLTIIFLSFRPTKSLVATVPEIYETRADSEAVPRVVLGIRDLYSLAKFFLNYQTVISSVWFVLVVQKSTKQNLPFENLSK